MHRCDCDPKLKEWLVDEVGDRGLKRWEKAVGDCLEVVRRMTSECLARICQSRISNDARFETRTSHQCASIRLVDTMTGDGHDIATGSRKPTIPCRRERHLRQPTWQRLEDLTRFISYQGIAPTLNNRACVHLATLS